MNSTGYVSGICISARRGIPKSPVDSVNLVENYGLEHDAHAGNWHRQISILCLEEIEKFQAGGADVKHGDFGENLIIKGINLKEYPVGTRLRIGDALIETTQIGKVCHHHCRIFQQMGECIMPKSGVFAKVLQGGAVKIGDKHIRGGVSKLKGMELPRNVGDIFRLFPPSVHFQEVDSSVPVDVATAVAMEVTLILRVFIRNCVEIPWFVRFRLRITVPTVAIEKEFAFAVVVDISPCLRLVP